ncbi:unnamed protein product [Effrenium voratum]|nr:unnamed protein product [Effrenium voratum]
MRREDCPVQNEAQRPLASTLAEVCKAACGCVFEETNAQTDEATAAQMIALIGVAGLYTRWPYGRTG